MPKRGQTDEGGPAATTIPSPEADELVSRAIEGDIDAFAALFRLSVPVVFKSLYGRCADRALAEDLTSDTYIRAMRAMRTFKGTSRDFLAWITRIARNLFLDHAKSGRVRWEVVMDETPVTVSTTNTEKEAVAKLEGAELRRALEKLTPEQQEVVYLRFLRGLPIAEVAEIVGRNEGAVKALQFRALKTLGKVLVEEGTVEESEEW